MGVKRKMDRVQPRGETLDDLLQKFLHEKKLLNKSKDTIRCYQESYMRFRKYLVDAGFSLFAEEVNEEYVKGFTQRLLYEEVPAVKAASVNHYLRSVRAFLYWCQQQSKVKDFMVKMVKEPETIKETYSERDQLLLTQKPKKTEGFVAWRSWALVNWLIATGHRPGTICNIQMRDISFETKEIIVRVSKTGKVSVQPLSTKLAGVMMEYIRMWRYNAKDVDYVFCNIADEKMSVNAIQLSFKKFATARGTEISSLKSGRSAFAKSWVLNGGDAFRLQKLMLHSDISTTKKYVDMFGADLQKDFDRFNPLDNLSTGGVSHKVKRR